jgi:hypothetical protein
MEFVLVGRDVVVERLLADGFTLSRDGSPLSRTECSIDESADLFPQGEPLLTFLDGPFPQRARLAQPGEVRVC